MDTTRRVGFRTTAAVMYGSIKGPRHLLWLRAQQKKGGGFIEVVPLSFVHMEAPIYLKGRARRGPIVRPGLGG